MLKKWIEIVANVLFWVISSWLIIAVFSIESQEIEIINGERIETINRNKYLMYYFFTGQVFFAAYFYAQFYLVQKLRNRKEIGGFLLKSIALSFICVYGYLHFVRAFVLPEPFAFPRISHGIFTFYAAVAIGYGFTKAWIRNERDKKQLELVKNQAELNLLRSQLHPHFLFNTMNNLLAMVDQRKDPKLAESIHKLSDLLRYVVYDARNDKVRVADEIDFIRNLSELHLLRFEDGEIDFKLSIKGKYDQQYIEPGILLCYVENAFKHGVQPETPSFIHINVDITLANVIDFSIRNSIPPGTDRREKGGYGMTANAERLQLAYPGNYTLKIEDNDMVYAVRLILHTDESHNS